MTTNLNDAIRIVSAFLPNRAYRRKMAGARCVLCGLGITAPDLGLVEIETASKPETRPMHVQCTSLLWDMAEELNDTEDDWAEDPQLGVEDAPASS